MGTNGDNKIQKNFLEWTIFAFSLLLIVGIFIYLTIEVVRYEPLSPDLNVSYVLDPTDNTPYRYHFTVNNSGGETAEDVKIKATLEESGKVIEEVEVDIAFLPRRSRREGWIVFQENPARVDSVRIRVTGFKRP
jgi:uncharacterized protein (TIGR02588 family)